MTEPEPDYIGEEYACEEDVYILDTSMDVSVYEGRDGAPLPEPRGSSAPPVPMEDGDSVVAISATTAGVDISGGGIAASHPSNSSVDGVNSTSLNKIDFLSLMNPTLKQRAFLWALDRYRYILYGGAAGGGKSYCLRWASVWQLLKLATLGVTRAEVGIFCETYPTLHSRHLSKIGSEFPAYLGTLHDADKSDLRYVMAPEYGGGVIRFRNLDNVEKYKSSEFAMICVDELTFNSYQVFNDLRFRLRWPGVKRPVFAAATNPGGPGHGWVKDLWIDRTFPEELKAPATLASGKKGRLCDEFIYIPARTVDNPHLAESYDSDLMSLPEAMRKAYRDGSWDVFAGMVFQEWSRDKHVIEPFKIPRHWQRFMSYDHGYSKPYSLLWIAIDEDGRAYVYRELYGCYDDTPNQGCKEDAETIAEHINRIERGANEGEANGGDFIYRVADPAIWSKTGQSSQFLSIADVFSSKGIHFARANNDRLQGKMAVHEFLRTKNPETGQDITPKLQVFSTCRHLIRTLPALPYDKVRVEDVDSDAEDHVYDSLRYFCMARPRGSDIPDKPKRELDWFEKSIIGYEEDANERGHWLYD